MDIDYENWLKNEQRITRKQAEMDIERFEKKPIFSIILPVYNTEEIWLRKCIESVRKQYYPYWELCIADDASDKPHVKNILKEYSDLDSRVKLHFRTENGHISETSNSALKLATGEYIALLDHDDELSNDALFEMASVINVNPEVDMIYSDEDKIDVDGNRSYPFFKPDWSPETFMSNMYTCHFGIYKTELVKAIGGFRTGFEGSQDYDLVLRFTEKTDQILHVPKILYHWRMHPQSTSINVNSKDYAYEAGKKAIQEALDRRGEGGTVESSRFYPGRYRVIYPFGTDQMITIILHKTEGLQGMVEWIENLIDNTYYKKIEIIIVESGGTSIIFNQVKGIWSKIPSVKVRYVQLQADPGSHSIQETIRKYTTGEFILFIEKMFKVKNVNWIEEIAGYCHRQHIGSVYCKSCPPHYSYYPEIITNTIKDDYDCVMVHREDLISKKVDGGYTLENLIQVNEKRSVFIPV